MRERNYNQNCALARASDLLGERWTLLIVRDLLVAPRRFGELEQRLKGMGTNLLAKRLKDMRATGLIAGGEERTPYRQSGDWIAWVRLDQQGFSYGLGEPDEVPDILFSSAIQALRVPDRLIAEMESGMRDRARRFIDCFAVS